MQESARGSVVVDKAFYPDCALLSKRSPFAKHVAAFQHDARIILGWDHSGIASMSTSRISFLTAELFEKLCPFPVAKKLRYSSAVCSCVVLLC
jgi:hypothetical protein